MIEDISKKSTDIQIEILDLYMNKKAKKYLYRRGRNNK